MMVTSESDDAGADHAEPLRHGIELERTPGIDDAVVVVFCERQLDRHRTGRDDDVGRCDDLRLAADRREFDLFARQQPAMAHEPVDLVRLEQARNTVRELAHDTGTPFLHGGEVELHAAGLDAVFTELVFSAVVQLGRLQQCLRRDTARVQAGTAERVAAVPVLPFVDARDFLAVLRRPDRRHIACGPGAYDDDVVALAH